MLQVCTEYKGLISRITDLSIFETSKDIVETQDKERFYKVMGTTLYVPTFRYVTYHLNELDKLIESISGFAINSKIGSYHNYEWNNLITQNHTEEEDVINLIEYLKGCKIIAVDIETAGLSFMSNKLLAIGFCWCDNKAASITTFTPKVLEKLQELFSSTTIKFVWHNGKFDTGRLKTICNIDARVDQDTMLMHFVGINEKRGTHGLKYLGELYLQAPSWEDELQEYKKTWCRSNKIKLDQFTYDMIPVDILIPYLHRDVIATFRLFKLFFDLMRPEAGFIYSKLIEASNTFRDIEIYGNKVNTEYLNELDVTLKGEIDLALHDIATIAKELWNPEKYKLETGAKSAPDVFNVGSPNQLKWLYVSGFGIKLDSTDEKTLTSVRSKLSELNVKNPDNKEVQDALNITDRILNFRKLQKQHKTYVVGLQEVIEADGKIHSTYNLHGTETGRLSSSDPNMHNIPRDKKIKNLFIADEGTILVQLDYSQAELRVLAHLSNDPWLIQVYKDDKDLHDAVAEEMFGPDFNKEQRVKAKTINFGIAYGRGPANIAEVFGMSFEEAKRLIDKWFQPMPYVKRFIEDRRALPAKGTECTTPFGRQRHFIITDDNKVNIQNESVNFPIQSVASDLTLLSLIDIHKELKARGLGNIINTVHDSIIIQCKPENAEEVARIGQKIMRETPNKYLNTPVPFKADAEKGLSWGNLEKM